MTHPELGLGCSTLSVVLAGEIVKLQLREVRMEFADLQINEPKESSI